MKAEPDIKYMVIKHGMNLFPTREFEARMRRQNKQEVKFSEYVCPMCKLINKVNLMQTKEHILGGECIITKVKREEIIRNLARQLAGWDLNRYIGSEILTQIRKEWTEVKTEYYGDTLTNHAKSACLIGIWSNKLVQRLVKILVEKANWVEEVSMERVIELARINMKGAVKMMETTRFNREGMEEEISEWEQEELEGWKKNTKPQVRSEKLSGSTDEQVKAFRQRWKQATMKEDIRGELEEWLEKREKITKKEQKEKKRQEEKERTKRKREEEQEEYLKKLRGGGEESKMVQNKTYTRIMNNSPFCPNRGGSRDKEPRGESDTTMCHGSTNTTLHYTTLHYTI